MAATTNVVYHVHGAKPEGWFYKDTCALRVGMSESRADYLSAYFATPDDLRTTIASLTEALAQWEAHLAAKGEA